MCFALSSRYEPFGMTAVEAMACGTPTVRHKPKAGLWEQVVWGLEALCANPFDPTAYGMAIASILQYPRISSQLAKHGSQAARAKFTWTGVAQQLLRVLESVEPQIRPEGSEELPTGPRAAWAIDPSESELWKTATS